jgi:hypothetical protein
MKYCHILHADAIKPKYYRAKTKSLSEDIIGKHKVTGLADPPDLLQHSGEGSHLSGRGTWVSHTNTGWNGPGIQSSRLKTQTKYGVLNRYERQWNSLGSPLWWVDAVLSSSSYPGNHCDSGSRLGTVSASTSISLIGCTIFLWTGKICWRWVKHSTSCILRVSCRHSAIFLGGVSS